jgi:hypothetical protein
MPCCQLVPCLPACLHMLLLLLLPCPPYIHQAELGPSQREEEEEALKLLLAPLGLAVRDIRVRVCSWC